MTDGSTLQVIQEAVFPCYGTCLSHVVWQQLNFIRQRHLQPSAEVKSKAQPLACPHHTCRAFCMLRPLPACSLQPPLVRSRIFGEPRPRPSVPNRGLLALPAPARQGPACEEDAGGRVPARQLLEPAGGLALRRRDSGGRRAHRLLPPLTHRSAGRGGLVGSSAPFCWEAVMDVHATRTREDVWQSTDYEDRYDMLMHAQSCKAGSIVGALLVQGDRDAQLQCW